MSRPETTLPVSAIVLTYNEEENLEACLGSLHGWVGEIVLVDSESTDRTLEIAERFTDRIESHQFESYGQQRNWSQTMVPLRFLWVLHVDADERVTPELRESIESFFRFSDHQRYNGAMFTRRTVFLGRWIRHGGHYPAFHLRLFRRDRGACEDRAYDQHFLAPPPVARLDGDLIDVVASDLDRFMTRHVRWAGAEARELRLGRADVVQGRMQPRLGRDPIKRRRWYKAVAYGRLPLFARAFAYFFYRYIIRRGFLDGTEGLIFHFLQGCWLRFYIDAKIWEADRKR